MPPPLLALALLLLPSSVRSLAHLQANPWPTSFPIPASFPPPSYRPLSSPPDDGPPSPLHLAAGGLFDNLPPSLLPPSSRVRLYSDLACSSAPYRTLLSHLSRKPVACLLEPAVRSRDGLLLGGAVLFPDLLVECHSHEASLLSAACSLPLLAAPELTAKPPPRVLRWDRAELYLPAAPPPSELPVPVLKSLSPASLLQKALSLHRHLSLPLRSLPRPRLLSSPPFPPLLHPLLSPHLSASSRALAGFAPPPDDPSPLLAAELQAATAPPGPLAAAWRTRAALLRAICADPTRGTADEMSDGDEWYEVARRKAAASVKVDARLRKLLEGTGLEVEGD